MPPDSEHTLVIKNVTILDFASLTTHKNRNLLIKDNRIAWIGDSDTEPSSAASGPSVLGPSGESETIDAGGLYLVPGFVNTHAHTAMTLLRGVAEDTNVYNWFNKPLIIFICHTSSSLSTCIQHMFKFIYYQVSKSNGKLLYLT